MSEMEKYNALLLELGALLSTKNDRIIIQNFEISNLARKLEEAEKIISELKGTAHEQRS